jgi:hypothetical protein
VTGPTTISATESRSMTTPKSAWNNGIAVDREHVSLYRGLNYSGDSVCVPRGRSIPDLGGMKTQPRHINGSTAADPPCSLAEDRPRGRATHRVAGRSGKYTSSRP